MGDAGTEVMRVHSDSRTLQQGDLFVALRGDTFDGAQYLAQARNKGASAGLCSEQSSYLIESAGLAALVVPDSKVALGVLAGNWRARFRLPLIAVTGSNGKTTVTQMVGAILSAWKGEKSLVTHGNFNNDIGVPLTLLRLRAEHQAAVVELGMNHPGEIASLASMVKPTVALVNNAQREHLEFMATVEAVARENGAVLEALGEHGVAVFPVDDPFAQLWADICGQKSRMTFAGLDSGLKADVTAIGAFEGGAWRVEISTPAGTTAVMLQVVGRHNVRNALAAVACAVAAEIPLEIVRAGLESFRPVKGRSRVFSLVGAGREWTVADDTYNANPDSVRAAVELLADLPAPRLLVLGDMGEVGNSGPELHAEVGAYAETMGIDRLMATGALSIHAAGAFSGAQHFPDQITLIEAVLRALPDVRSVLVKGSRFMKMEKVVAAIEAHETATEASHHAA